MKAALPALLLAFLASCGRRDEEARIEAAVRAAVEHEEAGRLDEAMGEYRKALTVAGDSSRWKARSMELRAILKDLESRKDQVAAATAEFERFRERAARADAASAELLLREGRDLQVRVRDSGLPWVPELKILLESLEAKAGKK